MSPKPDDSEVLAQGLGVYGFHHRDDWYLLERLEYAMYISAMLGTILGTVSMVDASPSWVTVLCSRKCIVGRVWKGQAQQQCGCRG